MSSMNATHSAVTPAPRIGGAQRVDVLLARLVLTIGRPVGREQRERRAARSRSARLRRGCRRRRARAAARFAPAKRSSGGATATISARSGLPTHSTRLSRPSPSTPRKPGEHAVRAVASTRFASPAFASRLWTTSGVLRATAISAPGNDAKPPKPSTTFGRRRRRTRHACTHADSEGEGPEQQAAAVPCRARRETRCLRSRRRAAARGAPPCRRACRARTRCQPRRESFAATASPERCGRRFRRS